MRHCCVLLALVFQAAAGQTGPANLDFEQPGGAGQVPPGWFVPRSILDAGYRAELRSEGCHRGSGCAVVVVPPAPPANIFGNLMQRFDAAPYRGKTIRFRAWVRLEAVDAGDRAQLWLRVDRKQGMGFFDNMDNRPVRSAAWAQYEITGEIDADAEYLNIGVMSIGKGRAWIDDVTFEAVPEPAAGPETAAARAAIEKLYARIDAAYGAGDMDAVAALATPDARYGSASMKIPFRVGLDETRAEIRQGARITTRTTITSMRLMGDEAVVATEVRMSRATATGETAYVTTSRDTWARTPEGWRIKELAYTGFRTVPPPSDPEGARKAIPQLKKYAVPLASVRAGTPMDDLAAFGKAVGDARIVALGEATHGTREFFQMKHRLLEYLVKEKGFTVFAIEANWPESLAVDRYIKTGEGDPRKALAGMYFWTWNTREVLEMIEWMRAWNMAAGKHSTLTFTSFDMQTPNVAAADVLAYVRKNLPVEAAVVEAAYKALPDITRNSQVYSPDAAAIAARAEAVVKLLDGKRETSTEWRDARQAAEIVRQACAMRGTGLGPGYRDEMMARNVDWLAREAHPGEKIVLWAHNGHVSFGGDGMRPMGAWLRERFGSGMYVVGFAFRRGELRAIGMAQGRFLGGPVTHTAAALPAAEGDAVLSASGMPILFLDMRAVPAASDLGRWLAARRLYLAAGATWTTNVPESNLHPQAMSKLFDGLIFVEVTHAAEGLPR